VLLPHMGSATLEGRIDMGEKVIVNIKTFMPTATRRRPDIGRGVNDLALQIRQRHDIVIDNAERADAGGGEIKQNRRAEAAGANDQHARGFELGLAGAADLAQHNVARIAFEFFGVEHD
jgi:hypothetical protein